MNGGIRVLHVDDDPGLSEVTERFLERADDRIAVESAADAEEGLGLLDDDVDCVVSDHEMPGRNGVEFLRAVREESPDLPFILFTGKGGETVASDAISAGVTDYLRKQSNTDHYELLANRVVDAVEGVRTERRLKAQRRRFGILFERLTQPVVEAEYEDDEPIVQQVNPAFEEVFGYDASAIVGESLDEYIVPEGHDSEAERINRQVQDGASTKTDALTRRTADGEREFLLQNAAYDDGSGGFAIYTDVSARKERERELQHRNTRLTALFENFPEPTATYRYEDGEPRVLETNRAFRETFGFDPGEAAGEHIDDLIVPPAREEEAEHIDERVREGETIDEVLSGRPPTGSASSASGGSTSPTTTR